VKNRTLKISAIYILLILLLTIINLRRGNLLNEKEKVILELSEIVSDIPNIIHNSTNIITKNGYFADSLSDCIMYRIPPGTCTKCFLNKIDTLFQKKEINVSNKIY
jgi:hypothetical protein